MRKRYSSLPFIFLALLLALNGCKSTPSQSREPVQEKATEPLVQYPTVDSPKELELSYQRTTFGENNASDFLNCEMYFSDSEGQEYVFHAYQYLGSMNGYQLYDQERCQHYQGAKFYIKWNKQGSGYSKSADKFNRIEELRLISTDEYLHHKTLHLSPGDDIEDRIYHAGAGDSIHLKSGVYYLDHGINISSDHLTLYGDPGTFIFGDLDTRVVEVNANFITLNNLYFSHLNAEDAACSGDVIFVNSFSCTDVTITNCDINGCGVTGVYFYAYDDKEVNYRVENSFLHNNSEGAFSISWENYQEDPEKYPGVVLSNNKVWNNGEERIQEPDSFKHVFTFNIPEKDQQALQDTCNGCQLYHFAQVVDSLLPIYTGEDRQVMGYLNPTDFSEGKQSGVLVYEKFKPIYFREQEK